LVEKDVIFERQGKSVSGMLHVSRENTMSRLRPMGQRIIWLAVSRLDIVTRDALLLRLDLLLSFGA
jgi:hypothetical protein